MHKKKIGDKTSLNKEQQIIKNLANKNKISTSQVLLRLSNFANEYFITNKSDVFAVIDFAGAEKMVNITSSTFSQWLRIQYYMLFNQTVSRSMLQDVIETISARELMHCRIKKNTHFRLCQEDNKLYIDLMNNQEQVIEITENSWSIKKTTSICFERPISSFSIVTPKMNGDLNKLKKHLVVKNEEYILVLSFILSCFMTDGAYPILILQGGQSSGKSTLSKMIKTIVDPSVVLVQSPPKNEKDLFIAAKTNHLLVFDNLSTMDAYLSDSFCRLSTGGAILTKKLYTDDEASVISAKKPLILNGIDYLATRNDLADRSIIITLQNMSGEGRKDEKALWEDFQNDLPDILGGIYDVLSIIKRNYNSTRIRKTSRMADFVKWITAAECVLGLAKGKFLEIYENNKNEAAIDTLEQDLLALSIYEVLKEQDELIGTSTFIVQQLRNRLMQKGIDPRENWMPINKLKDSIRRIEPVLGRVNIHYQYIRGKERLHRLFKRQSTDGYDGYDG